MPLMRNLRKLLQKSFWPKVIIAFSSMLLLVTDFTYLVHAGFSSPVAIPLATVLVSYPTTNPLKNIGGQFFAVTGQGNQVVFRLGSGHTLSDLPSLLGSSCGTLMMFPSDAVMGPMGPNDFVYGIRVDYQANPAADVISPPLDTVQVGICDRTKTRVTSAGYCNDPFPDPAKPPTISGQEQQSAIDFSFNRQPINVGESVIFFYTSPDPPVPVPALIAGGVAESNGIVRGTLRDPNFSQSPIYGPCQVMELVKEVACRDVKGNMSPFSTGPISVVRGSTVVYRFTVTNKGKTNLDNVTVTDSTLGFTNKPVASSILPGGSASVNYEVAATTNGVITNTARADATYNVPIPVSDPSQIGIPSGQTVTVSDNSDEVKVTVGDTGLCPGMTIKCEKICFRPPILCQIFLNKLPPGTILIGGINNNNPVNIQTNGTAIRNALFPCPGANPNCPLTPLQQLNQQFVAAQLSLAANGGVSSPVAMNVLWSNLSCYPDIVKVLPVTLSNGFTFTPDSMVKDLFDQARKAITENRTVENRNADMIKLAKLFKLLNSCNKSTL